jgi:hypothetical protein
VKLVDRLKIRDTVRRLAEMLVAGITMASKRLLKVVD